MRCVKILCSIFAHFLSKKSVAILVRQSESYIVGERSLVRDHMINYLLDNNLLHEKQYGFIKGRSTSLQLLDIMDKWTEYLEHGGQIDVMYSDFENL